jgi:uncharacterized membrane protein
MPTSNDSQAQAADDDRAQEFVGSVIVARPRHELFAFWRDFANLPKFMQKVRKVTVVDSLSSIWTVAGPGGESTDWEFLVTDEEEDRLIAWSASGNTPVKYSGRVEFKDVPPETLASAAIPAVRSVPATEVTATFRYEPHAGILDTLIAKVSGSGTTDELPVQTGGDLQRFKEAVETR